MWSMAASSARCASASVRSSRVSFLSAVLRLAGARDLAAECLRAYTFSTDRGEGRRSRDHDSWVENAAFGSSEGAGRSSSSGDHGAPPGPAQDGDWNPFREQAKDWSAAGEHAPANHGGMDRTLGAGEAPREGSLTSRNAEFSFRGGGSNKSSNTEFSLKDQSGRASWWNSETHENSDKLPNEGFTIENRDSGTSWYSRELQQGSNKPTNANLMSWLNNERQGGSNKFANAGSFEDRRSGRGVWQHSEMQQGSDKTPNVDFSLGSRSRRASWYGEEMQEGSDESLSAEFPAGRRSGGASSSSRDAQEDDGFQSLLSGLSSDNSAGDEAYSFKRIREGSGMTDVLSSNDPFASDDNISIMDTFTFMSESFGTSGRGIGDRAKDMSSILGTNAGDDSIWGAGADKHLKFSDTFSMQDLSSGKSSLFSSQQRKLEEMESFSYEELGEMLCELRPPLGQQPDEEMGFSFLELHDRLEKMHDMLEAKSPEHEAFIELKRGVKELRSPKSPRLGSLQLSADDLSALNNTGVLQNINESLEYVRPNFELLRKYYSPEQMSSKELLSIAIAKARKEFQMHESDTGSPQVQISILTMKIENLNRHFRENHNKKRDKHSRRGLNGMIEYRKRLLWYLRRRDWDAYCNVLTKLRLPDIIHEKRL